MADDETVASAQMRAQVKAAAEAFAIDNVPVWATFVADTYESMSSVSRITYLMLSIGAAWMRQNKELVKQVLAGERANARRLGELAAGTATGPVAGAGAAGQQAGRAPGGVEPTSAARLPV